jgi:hypothetical protein
MTAPELSGRRQAAVLWPALGAADKFGKPTLGPPVQLQVRWDVTESEVLAPQGGSVGYDVAVQLDRAVAEGSLMALGTVAAHGDLFEVKQYTETADFRGRWRTRTAKLLRRGQ